MTQGHTNTHELPEWMKERTTTNALSATPPNVEAAAPGRPTNAPETSPLPYPRLSHHAEDMVGALGSKQDVLKMVATQTFDKEGRPLGYEVILSGMWLGSEIKGLIRAIEKQYKAIKHNMTRKALQTSAKSVK